MSEVRILKRIATWGCTVTGVLLFCWGQIDIIWRNMIWCKLFQIHHLIIYLLELNQSISIWKRAVLQLPWRGLQHVARIIMIIKYSKKKQNKNQSIVKYINVYTWARWPLLQPCLPEYLPAFIRRYTCFSWGKKECIVCNL